MASGGGKGPPWYETVFQDGRTHVYDMAGRPPDAKKRTALDPTPAMDPFLSIRLHVYDVIRLHGLAMTAEEILGRMPAYPTRPFKRPTLDEVKHAMVCLAERGECFWHPNEAGEARLTRLGSGFEVEQRLRGGSGR